MNFIVDSNRTCSLSNSKNIIDKLNNLNSAFNGAVPEQLHELFKDTLLNTDFSTAHNANRILENQEYKRQSLIRNRLAKKLEQRNKK